MDSSFFFLQAEQDEQNSIFLSDLKEYAIKKKQQVYVINRPLGDGKYSYKYKKALVLLIPKHKIIFIDFGDSEDEFEEFYEDFIEDIGSISDKFQYKEKIGRPRKWKKKLIKIITYNSSTVSVSSLLTDSEIIESEEQRRCELLISLLTGSINDIERVKLDVPETILDKIKRKILLFDGDQTRFLYQKQPKEKSKITIQGLSGTGKTELLLHKLKELYVADNSSKILFTCHNKILASNLRNRIPDFFNFMKVEQQIKWEERLWCVHAWGSGYDPHSGAYRYICEHYDLQFYTYARIRSFDRVCQLAIEELNSIDIKKFDYAFDYILIDESQDFSEPFFELCQKVTRKLVYIAGDVFQGIFDSFLVHKIEPDFLLNKCYRTDPRTLMFAHALGMGLFETPKLRWLDDEEWKACGYVIAKNKTQKNIYRLKREPLRRFEDLESDEIKSMELVKTGKDSIEDIERYIIEIIDDIKSNHETVTPNDISIIFIDTHQSTYLLSDMLEISIPRYFGWEVNKAYESKRIIDNTIFISNKNNVKGLEFPFVICVSKKIHDGYGYRNALYMMLTRSFIKTYLLISKNQKNDLFSILEKGLSTINEKGYMQIDIPSSEEQREIKTKIKYDSKKKTFYEFIYEIFDEIGIEKKYKKPLFDTTKGIIGEVFDYDEAKEVIEFTYSKMKKD